MNTIHSLIPIRDAFATQYQNPRFGLVSVGIGKTDNKLCLSVITTQETGLFPSAFRGIVVKTRQGGQAHIMLPAIPSS